MLDPFRAGRSNTELTGVIICGILVKCAGFHGLRSHYGRDTGEEDLAWVDLALTGGSHIQTGLARVAAIVRTNLVKG